MESKRMREEVPTPDDFIIVGKDIQNKSGRSVAPREFREFFGTNAVVACQLWKLLLEKGLLPANATIAHQMWTLHFLRAYPKQGPLCATAGGSSGALDPKTLREYMWPFVRGIAGLESEVVSVCRVLIFFTALKNNTLTLISLDQF